jgi:signal transduction histidine kinase
MADVFIQVVGPDGEVQSRSGNLRGQNLPLDPTALQNALRGLSWFDVANVDGQSVREYVAPIRVGGGGSAPGVIQVARPTASIDQSLGALQTSLLLVGAGGVLVSLIAGWFLARTALGPIDRLAAAAQAIGSARDFGRRVPVPRGGDEVARLAREFNGMLGHLAAAFGQVEGALAAQRRFVADASHELRTPLSVVRGNLDLLALSEAEDERLQPLADARAETERMGRLVSQLLLLAQADAGQHLTLARVDLPAVLHNAFRAARFFRDDVELCLTGVPESAWVMGDADRLEQVLLILLDNALKFTPPGGRVTLGAEPLVEHGRSGIVVRVTDTGPGVPAHEHERIFERFARVDRARGGAGGAGLGLAIGRWIVAEHGGRISIDECAEHGGCVFSVWLPLAEDSR